MDAQTKIVILVETIINGNKIKGDKYYENLLKNISKNDINFTAQFDYNMSKLFGTKLDMLQQIAKKG